MSSTLRSLLTSTTLAASSGCSLIYTRGPQPEVRPPPECTASVAAPVTDTVLATLSVALFGLGVLGTGAVFASGTTAVSCPVSGCNNNLGLALALSGSAVLVGAALGTLFTVSAVNGYQRTAACRASQAPDARQPSTGAHLLVPEDCFERGTAPRTCPAGILFIETGTDAPVLSVSGVSLTLPSP